jgi:hypothetical protein
MNSIFQWFIIIKPTDPSLSWSANKITDLLNDRSPVIDGSISSCPLLIFLKS